jgi:hypothetical protein
MTFHPVIPNAVLYDSEDFIVCGPEDGYTKSQWAFEVVRKKADPRPLAVFLHGASALAFADRIAAWQANTPEREEVEAYLDRLTQLGVHPLRADH